MVYFTFTHTKKSFELFSCYLVRVFIYESSIFSFHVIKMNEKYLLGVHCPARTLSRVTAF